MNVVVRAACPSDAVSMYGISVRTHQADYYDTLIPKRRLADFQAHYAWSEQGQQHFCAWLEPKFRTNDWHIYVAEHEQQIVGYTLAHTETIDKLVLKALFVDPNTQGSGVGRSLLQRSLRDTGSHTTVELSVIADNAVAKSLYDKYGFRVTRRDNHTFFGASLDIMQLHVN